MILFDYKCVDPSCATRFEELSASWEDTKKCPECGTVSSPVQTPIRFNLPGTDPAFPTAWDQWEKKRAEKMRQERKKEEKA